LSRKEMAPTDSVFRLRQRRLDGSKMGWQGGGDAPRTLRRRLPNRILFKRETKSRRQTSGRADTSREVLLPCLKGDPVEDPRGRLRPTGNLMRGGTVKAVPFRQAMSLERRSPGELCAVELV
jgi:hypothetical protein